VCDVWRVVHTAVIAHLQRQESCALDPTVPHVYTTQATFTVTVTVIDSSGQTTTGTAAVSIGP
jgi:hypothetical protein